MVDMAVRGVVVDARRFLGPLRLMQLTFSCAQHSGLLSLDRPYVNIFVFKISKYRTYCTILKCWNQNSTMHYQLLTRDLKSALTFRFAYFFFFLSLAFEFYF